MRRKRTLKYYSGGHYQRDCGHGYFLTAGTLIKSRYACGSGQHAVT